MTTYQYSDGTTSCGHNHRTPLAARLCCRHLQLIREWWRDGGCDVNEEETFSQYRARSIDTAEILEEEEI